uniref:Uncharacterized protein n=1 Tax=Anguilla anguilla TaxID=7936 RepID=A0A0E9R829_ANGAN
MATDKKLFFNFYFLLYIRIIMRLRGFSKYNFTY